MHSIPEAVYLSLIIAKQQMKSLRDVLKVQTSQESCPCPLACKDRPLTIPSSPHQNDVGLMLALLLLTVLSPLSQLLPSSEAG